MAGHVERHMLCGLLLYDQQACLLSVGSTFSNSQERHEGPQRRNPSPAGQVYRQIAAPEQQPTEEAWTVHQQQRSVSLLRGAPAWR